MPSRASEMQTMAGVGLPDSVSISRMRTTVACRSRDPPSAARSAPVVIAPTANSNPSALFAGLIPRGGPVMTNLLHRVGIAGVATIETLSTRL